MPPSAGPDFTAPSQPVCYRHSDRPTGISCQRCHRPICGECMNPAAVGFQCPSCVASGRASVRAPRTRFGAVLTPGGGNATKVLMGVLVAVFVLNFASRGILGSQLVLSNYSVAGGQFWRLLTYGFVSVGLLGLAMNLLVLWMAGRAMEDLLGTSTADAVVLTGTDRDDQRPAVLTSAGRTFCSFGRPWAAGEPPHDWVDVDGAAGTTLAVEHLLETGHRRIAFLGWPEQSPTGEDRRAGWLRAVRAAGAPGPVVEGRSDNDARAAQAAVEEMLTSADPPDAVVCASDTLAFGAHRAARALDRTLGLVGFDATPVATALGFASVAQPVREAAHTCMELLLPRLRGQPTGPRGELLSPRLLVPAP